jgi:hypothetical protein
VMDYMNGKLLGQYEKEHDQIRHTPAYKKQESEIMDHLRRCGVDLGDGENDDNNIMVVSTEQGFQIVMFDFGTLARK